MNATGSVSGAERVLLRLADEAIKMGDDVVLVSPSGPILQHIHPEVRHRECKPIGLNGLRSPVSILKYGASLLRAAIVLLPLMRSSNVLVINNTLASPLAFLFQKRLLWLLHDVLGNDLRGAIGKTASRFFRLVIPVSYAAANPLPTGTAVRVVLNGTPLRESKENFAREGTTSVIGCLAALTPWKGQKTLIKAVAELAGVDFRLEFAGSAFPGDEEYARELRVMAKESPVGEKIHFLGNVDPYMTLQSWDLMVLPSVAPEAMPLSLLEALSMGVPCIATNIGGSLEILRDINGDLVPPSQPHALAERIRELLNDEHRRMVLGEAGRDLVSTKYSLEERTKELYWVVAASTDMAGKVPPRR
ncbi:glycosyltransferase family 4 protein [Arthrobacter nitrophenolicus]|uniref:Glycosyltransferase family 1 protein n=1 Tax=Arthrobacter nitrophenolicus TaxID=683150 RepID=A0A4R5XZJ9_9MICC|nr:glycosyltransferase family 4 protein [Arthrobacter nitrophenolicus]TDL37403.1 glycosyltransferase family 1 protein [Arthrobacter nitrophenolicus]